MAEEDEAYCSVRLPESMSQVLYLEDKWQLHKVSAHLRLSVESYQDLERHYLKMMRGLKSRRQKTGVETQMSHDLNLFRTGVNLVSKTILLEVPKRQYG